MEKWTAAKKLLVSVAVPPTPARVPSQRPLAPSFASVTSIASDKGEKIMKIIRNSYLFSLSISLSLFLYEYVAIITCQHMHFYISFH